MTLSELIDTTSIQFLVDENGNKKAVLVDFALWQDILAALEQVEAIRPVSVAEQIHSLRGKYAFVPTSSDEFAQRKQEEIDLEQ
jgi:hypothetical protein